MTRPPTKTITVHVQPTSDGRATVTVDMSSGDSMTFDEVIDALRKAANVVETQKFELT
jgi:hypothetical protein